MDTGGGLGARAAARSRARFVSIACISHRPSAEMSLGAAGTSACATSPRQSVASGCGADTRVCRARTLAGACPWGGDEKCRLEPLVEVHLILRSSIALMELTGV